MKRILALALSVLMFTMLFGCGAPAAKSAETSAPAETPVSAGTPAPAEATATETAALAETTFAAAELEGKIRLLGRAKFTDEGLRCDWPACGFEFTAVCGGTLSFSTETSGSNLRFRVFVDGEETNRVLSLSSAGRKIAFKDLPAGNHTIRVVRDSDCVAGERMAFGSMTLSCAPDSLAPTSGKDLFIEFLGDSHTSGCGALGSNRDAWSSDLHSATRSYASVAAELLDADCVLVSRGGIGALKDVGGMTSQQLYRSALPFEAASGDYVYTREPDVVVIQLGGNDPDEDPDTAFHDAMVAYGKLVRELHPNAKIVYYWYSPKHATVFPTIAEELGGEEAGVFLMQTVHLGDGAIANGQTVGHPSVENHKVIGKEVAEFLKTNVLK